MTVPVGRVPEGAWFRTCITKREGVVLYHSATREATIVAFDTGQREWDEKALSVHIRVERIK